MKQDPIRRIENSFRIPIIFRNRMITEEKIFITKIRRCKKEALQTSRTMMKIFFRNIRVGLRFTNGAPTLPGKKNDITQDNKDA